MFTCPTWSRCARAVALCALVAFCACASGGPSAEQRAADLNRRKREAATHVDARDFRGALEILEPLSREADADPQLFVMMGEAHEGLGDVAAAIANYEDAIRAAYTDPGAHLKLGTLLMKNGKTGRALTEFELAVKFNDRDPLARYNYGLALHELGREDASREQFLLARDLAPHDPRYAEAAGIALAGHDDAGAVAAFEDAAALGADDASFHNNFGLALEKVGRTGDAEAHFRTAVDKAPGTASYRFNLAALLNRTGDFDEAERTWVSLIEGDGPRWEYRVYRARALLELERYADVVADGFPEDALAHAGDEAGAADRSPEPGEALEAVALAFRGLDNRNQALRFIRAAVSAAPDNPVYLNNYGVILAENGMLPEARQQWLRALEIDPANETARKNLSTFGP